MKAPLALTTGEPAGIGPDLAVTWAQRAREASVVAVADPGLLAIARQPTRPRTDRGRVSRTDHMRGRIAVGAAGPRSECDAVAGHLDVATCRSFWKR